VLPAQVWNSMDVLAYAFQVLTTVIYVGRWFLAEEGVSVLLAAQVLLLYWKLQYFARCGPGTDRQTDRQTDTRKCCSASSTTEMRIPARVASTLHRVQVSYSACQMGPSGPYWSPLWTAIGSRPGLMAGSTPARVPPTSSLEIYAPALACSIPPLGISFNFLINHQLFSIVPLNLTIGHSFGPNWHTQ
jgi:hypothetical protein